MEIVDSGMTFGPFDDTLIYYIEKSTLYKSLQNHSLKTVEFVLIRNTNKLCFIEAKSSAPGEKESLKEYVNNITKKFTDSFNITTSLLLNRHHDATISSNFISLSLSNEVFQFILVIRECKKDSLPAIKDILYKKLKPFLKAWNIDEPAIFVWNKEMAQKFNTVQ